MKLRAVSVTMLTVFVLSMLTLAFNIQPVESDWTWTETIYIRSDGSVDPDTAPISTVDNITYTFTDNVVVGVLGFPSPSIAVVVERDNIVLDGAHFTLQDANYLTSAKARAGIVLSGRSNVTVKNMGIKGFVIGIDLNSSSNNRISGNNIRNPPFSQSTIGIAFNDSSNNRIFENNITESFYGIQFLDSSNNFIYHNNFATVSVFPLYSDTKSSNVVDDGYPSGGNYWSGLIPGETDLYMRPYRIPGDDLYSGPYQNETGCDGIFDSPYIYAVQDRYPLIAPWPLKYKTYSLTVDPVFYDNTGTTLIQPSSWAIRFPGGTTITVSSPVTYNLTQTGDHSIVSIIWKGTEVFPETPPTTSLTSDMVWSPHINCILPTSLPISLSSSASYVGFKVEINGNLACNEVGISGAPILLSYSVTNGESWNDITLVNTTSNGDYSAVWMPPATGNYLVSATWFGNATFPGTTTIINLAVIPFKEQNVFSVTSNSTVLDLAFNSTSRVLSFTVTGPSDTTGYVNVYIAKTLVDNIADVKVYLEGDQLNYTVTSVDDSWLLHFTYRHSIHTVTISLGAAPFLLPQLTTPLSLGILAAALTVATVILISKIRRGTPPTILDGVFNKAT